MDSIHTYTTGEQTNRETAARKQSFPSLLAHTMVFLAGCLYRASALEPRASRAWTVPGAATAAVASFGLAILAAIAVAGPWTGCWPSW